MHALGPEGGLVAQDGGKGAQQLPSLTSQFAYTYKFRSLKGATEYHTEHQDGEEEDNLKGKGDKKAAAVSSMLLPGLCPCRCRCRCRWVCAPVTGGVLLQYVNINVRCPAPYVQTSKSGFARLWFSGMILDVDIYIPSWIVDGERVRLSSAFGH